MGPDKQQRLAERLKALGVREEDLLEKFVLGSGSGGQKINKTSSCVYLKHLPTGTEVKCQASRSRELNRSLARQELADRLEEALFKEKSRRQQAIEKLRRQKRKRSKRAQAKVLAGKRAHGEKKRLRHSPASE